MKKFTFLLALAVTAVTFAVGMLGTDVARADSLTSGSAGVVGQGAVATEHSDFARGFKFKLKAKVDGGGSAQGEFSSRIHMRNSDRVIGLEARFNEGEIHGNEATLAGKARVFAANGDTLAVVPFKLHVSVGAPGEYKMAMHIGRRALEGKGVSGEVTIFREIPIGIVPRSPTLAR